MARSYHYFYIGDSPQNASDFSDDPPRLLTFSKIESGPEAETHPHLHSHLEIFYFESGAGVFVSGGRKFPLKAHDLVIANAESFHMQYSTSPEAPLVYYNFAVDRLKLPGNPPNRLSSEDAACVSFASPDNPFYASIREILSECTEKQYGYHSRIRALFTDLLVRTVRLFGSVEGRAEKPRSTNAEILAEVKRYIDLHYSENLNLDLLTELSYLQKSYFLHSFKKQFGIAPMKYLNLVRMEHAKLLLLSSDRSISEIALEVGFSNPTYFSEMFLKSEGESPSHYRKRVKRQTAALPKESE